MCRGVFIPLLFMGGIIGRLFREFAVTISVAVIASAVISLILTPVMCSLLLGQEGLHPKGRFNRGCERTFKAALRAYDRALNFVFRHQLSALLATLLLMAATGYLYVKMPKGFFPEQDTGWHYSAGAMATTTLGHRTRISLPAAVDDVRGSAI